MDSYCDTFEGSLINSKYVVSFYYTTHLMYFRHLVYSLLAHIWLTFSPYVICRTFLKFFIFLVLEKF